MGYEQVVLTGVQFPNIITRKQDFGASGGKSREGRAAQLTADIAAWQTRFAGSVTCGSATLTHCAPLHRCPWHHRYVSWYGKSAGHQQCRAGCGQPRCAGAGRCDAVCSTLWCTTPQHSAEKRLL